MTTPIWDLKSQYAQYQGQDVFDCLIAEYLLSEGRHSLTQEKTFEVYGVDNLQDLYTKQKSALDANSKLKYLYEEIEMPLVGILWKMEQTGITINREEMSHIGEFLDKEITRIQEDIYKESGAQPNLGSPLQVGKMLVEVFKIPLKKKASGAYSTNENDLAPLAHKYPIIGKLLEWREVSKLKSTYIKSLTDKIAEDGRIHTTYSQALVTTGRLSSSNPNLQNIPANSEAGRQIKCCFIAAPGHTLVSFDYSQQELRILAHLAQEETLIEAFKKGQDIHKVTASQLFNVAYYEVTKEQRNIAKTINFGIIYGMSSFGLSMTLGITGPEAAKFINAFFAKFPKIKIFLDNLLNEGKKNNYIETLLGRRRYVFEDPTKQTEIDNFVRRVLINFPMQGSAADLMKKTMVDVDREVLQKDPAIKLLLQIHDELIFEIKDDASYLESTIKKIKDIMSTVYDLVVPMEVEAKMGKSWGDMKPV